MRCPTLSELPPPPPGKTGWPWTVETPQLPPTMPDGAPWPGISIVTPSYNQGTFIEETIRSVLLQGYPALEYIITDGGSSDGSVEIIRKYESWLARWVSEKDRGHGHALNKGFARATGEIFGWINSDDFYFWGALGILASSLGDARNEFFYGDCLIRYVEQDRVAYYVAPPVRQRFLTMAGIIYQHSAFWRASVHEAIREDLNCAVDSELWLRLVPKCRAVQYINYPLGVSNFYSTTKTSSPAYALRWKEDNELIGRVHQLNWPLFSFNWFYRRSPAHRVDFRLNRFLATTLRNNKTNRQLADLLIARPTPGPP